VKGASGQKLGYFYYEEEPGRRTAAKLLTKDEARRIAANETRMTKNGKALLAARDTEGDYRRIGWTTRSASFL
jgi:hypothetical protein